MGRLSLVALLVIWIATTGSSCSGSVNSGRTTIVEVLPVVDSIRRAVLARVGQHELEDIAVANGMQTMRSNGIAKAAAGETSLAEVLRVSAEA